MFSVSRVSGASVSDHELLEDLRRVALALNSKRVPQQQYATAGKFDYSTVIRRFGTWNAALKLAQLEVSNEINITDERLFENILLIWQRHGRQPRRSELTHEPSTISQGPYNRRFGSWIAALEAFVEFANRQESDTGLSPVVSEIAKRRTGRDPSLRLRWHVLKRDSFTCCACGASPAITRGVELHVDHRIPWSKGGETVQDNLQSLCSVCNLGKSNLLPNLNLTKEN